MALGDFYKKILKKKTIVPGLIVSFLITYSLFFGFLCDRQIYGFKAVYLILFILFWAIGLFITVSLWGLIDILNQKIKAKGETAEEIPAKKKSVLFLISAIVLFLAWMPVLLASWPGFFTYDASKEFVQIWYPDVPIWGRISIIHSSLLLLS